MAKNKAKADADVQSRGKESKGAMSAKGDGKGTARKGATQDKGSQAGLGAKLKQLRDYFEESKVELKKVTWPSRKETIATSIAVIVLTIVMSLYLGVVDLGLSKIVAFILS